mmetsp:Transcript_50043/g.113607  ORF Transcript_50043/g.113607 Transcript_50043/m.113607 type:complete len:201 (+) Transcript_50043:524-1126(+)
MVRIMVPSMTLLAATSPRAALVDPLARAKLLPMTRRALARLTRSSDETEWSFKTFFVTSLRVTATSSSEAETMVSRKTGRLWSISLCIRAACSSSSPAVSTPMGPPPGSLPGFPPSPSPAAGLAEAGLWGGGPWQPLSFQLRCLAAKVSKASASLFKSRRTRSAFSTELDVSSPSSPSGCAGSRGLCLHISLSSLIESAL